MGKRRITIAFAALLAVGVLFQNCAAAPPPDLSELSQSSEILDPSTQPIPQSTPTVVTTPGVISTPRPDSPVVQQPTPTPTPTPSTPTPTPAVTQTYSWSVGAFGACDGANQTGIVQCVNGTGTVVADNYCTTAKPSATQACSLTYTCRVILSFSGSPSYYSGYPYYSSGSTTSYPTSCYYTCTSGTKSYNTYATNPTTCHTNPIGVAGTEFGTATGSTTKISRPFSSCTITRTLAQASSAHYEGESRCQ